MFDTVGCGSNDDKNIKVAWTFKNEILRLNHINNLRNSTIQSEEIILILCK